MGEFLKQGVAEVAISLVRVNPVSLRAIQRTSDKYAGLLASIREKGFLGTIEVRPAKDEKTGEDYYEIINGLQRYSCCVELGHQTIKVDILPMEDGDMLEAQLMMNIHRIETKPAQYAQQLRRILNLNPLWTINELAQRLGVSASFINERLSLLNVTPEIRQLIDDGEIKLANAYSLAKLPPEEQANFMAAAITDPHTKFIPAVTARVTEIRDALRKGGGKPSAQWQPTPHIRKLGELKAAAESAAVAQQIALQLGKDATLTDAVQMGIKFAINLDPASIAKQKADYEQAQQEKADAKARLEAKKAAIDLAALEEKQKAAAAKAAEVFGNAEKEGVDLDKVKEEAGEALKKRQEAAKKRAAAMAAKKEAEAAATNG